MNIVTPAQVEQRLLALSREVDAAHDEVTEAEHNYYTAKGEYEIGVADTRMRQSDGTVQQKEDRALLLNRESYMRLMIAEAVVRSSRANVNRLRTQVDLARSIGTSVRTGMDT